MLRKLSSHATTIFPACKDQKDSDQVKGAGQDKWELFIGPAVWHVRNPLFSHDLARLTDRQSDPRKDLLKC